jgi:hypothetical protein
MKPDVSCSPLEPQRGCYLSPRANFKSFVELLELAFREHPDAHGESALGGQQPIAVDHAGLRQSYAAMEGERETIATKTPRAALAR